MRRRRLHSIGWGAFLAGMTFLPLSCVDVVETDDIVPGIPEGNQIASEVGMAIQVKNGSESFRQGRMAPDMVQNNQQMRPLSEIHLFGFTSGDPQTDVNRFVDRSFIPLHLSGDQLNGINPDQSGNSKKAAFEKNVFLPVGTNRFIGYASVNEPFGTPAPADFPGKEKFFSEGRTETAWDKDPQLTAKASQLGNFFFAPYVIFEGDLNNGTYDNASRLLCWLNRVLDVEVAINGTPKSWADITVDENTELVGIYKSLIGMDAGSYRSVKGFMTYLYNTLEDLRTKWTDEKKYAEYQPFLTALQETILAPAGGIATIAEGPDGEKYPDDLIFNATKGADGKYSLKLVDAGMEASYKFPEELHLPDGALVLHHLTEEEQQKYQHPVYKHFLYNAKDVVSNVGLEVHNYAYPAEVIYRVDSNIRTADSPQSQNWQSTKKLWNTFVTDNFQGGADVRNATQSVAIEKPLRYLVAGVSTKARLFSKSLPDAQGSAGEEVQITQGGFPVTGILVGMQGYVGWDGAPIAAPGGLKERSCVYYDRELNDKSDRIVQYDDGKYPEQPYSYTLVLESPHANVATLQGGDAAAIREGYRTRQYVLLELENNERTFYGARSQLIHKGTRFYLVGELNLCDKTAELQGTECSVFQQGKFVNVELLITSLAGAYNSVPDLRSPTLNVSLQTSYEWQNGMVFDDDIDIVTPP